MKQISVLHLSLEMGGVEKVLVNMLNTLDFSSVNVTLYLLEKGILENHLSTYINIKYLDYKTLYPEKTFGRLFRYFLKEKQLIDAAKVLFYYLMFHLSKKDCKRKYFLEKAEPKIEKNSSDLLIEYHGYSADLLYLGATRFNTKKRVTWIHGMGWEKTYQKTAELRRYIYQKYDKVFCVSRAVKNHFLAQNSEIFERTEVFYNIINSCEIERFSEESCDEKLKHPAIVTVSRISEEKGIDRIPEIMRLLLMDGYFDIHWYIVGDGDQRSKIEKQCIKYGLTEQIHFLGQKINPYPFIKNADIYVQPSKVEAYCTTTMEAKILQKPIVVTDVMGMREQFEDEKTALIVKEQSSEALYQAIKRLIDLPELRKKLTDNLAAESLNVNQDLEKLYALLE